MVGNLDGRCSLQQTSHWFILSIVFNIKRHFAEQHTWDVNQLFTCRSSAYHFISQPYHQTVFMWTLGVCHDIQMFKYPFKLIDIFDPMIFIWMFTGADRFFALFTYNTSDNMKEIGAIDKNGALISFDDSNLVGSRNWQFHRVWRWDHDINTKLFHFRKELKVFSRSRIIDSQNSK